MRELQRTRANVVEPRQFKHCFQRFGNGMPKFEGTKTSLQIGTLDSTHPTLVTQRKFIGGSYQVQTLEGW